MRIAICVPSGDDVKADFWLSFSHMLMALRGNITIDLLNVRTSLIQASRFLVVKKALERGADSILFIDSDLMFPVDTLHRLLDHDKPIVGATYARRREPYGIHGVGIEPVPPGATGLWEMMRLPIGLSLISAEVFSKVPRPWFFTNYQDDVEGFVSEDYGFCDAARAAGYQLWCDLDLSHELGHVGSMIYSWDKAQPTPEPPTQWDYSLTPVGQQATRLTEAIKKCIENMV